MMPKYEDYDKAIERAVAAAFKAARMAQNLAMGTYKATGLQSDHEARDHMLLCPLHAGADGICKKEKCEWWSIEGCVIAMIPEWIKDLSNAISFMKEDD